jgi:hypothetical protein
MIRCGGPYRTAVECSYAGLHGPIASSERRIAMKYALVLIESVTADAPAKA